jgi:hypothetical protein
MRIVGCFLYSAWAIFAAMPLMGQVRAEEPIPQTATATPHASMDFINEAAFALPVELGRKLEEQQAQIDSVPAFAKKAHIAFTEWLFIGHRPGTPNFTNMGGVLGGDMEGSRAGVCRAGILRVQDVCDGAWAASGKGNDSATHWFRVHATEPA